MAVNGVEIAVGQVWRTRDGGQETIIYNDEYHAYPWDGQYDSYDVHGRSITCRESDNDLVALISQPGAEQADDNGWLRRIAAPEQPAVTKGQRVQVKTANSLVHDLPADEVSWNNVIAYRLLFDSAEPIEHIELPVPSPLDVQVGGDHYKKLGIQPVEYMHANGIPFMEGCAIKYLTRWRDKGGIADLEKARHFIDLLIALEQKAGAQ